MCRIGIGYDTHRLVKGRRLILGGVDIPYSKGLLGHSDADALLHAISDALLGASGQQDLGAHFPDTHSKYKNISSVKLLKEVSRLLKRLNYSIVNIDTVVIAQKPDLSLFKSKMAKNIAEALKLSLARVNVKATTCEGLGPIGRCAAIAAYAVALIKKR